MKKIQIDFAPLEGITGYHLRQVHHSHFGDIDRYYIPFIQPKQHGHFSHREAQDIQPQHNEGLVAIPQLLTNQAYDFLVTTEKLAALGYRQVNLNLGCPARTVVSKGRGAGQLADLGKLEAFLTEIFRYTPLPVSIKTRIGVEQIQEYESLLALYCQFPLAELIVHPRLQREYYEGRPHREVMEETLKQAPFPVCYNGDIVNLDGFYQLQSALPALQRVMIGRGLLRRPALAREILGGPAATMAELKAYHDDLYQRYRGAFGAERVVLFKMKEFWTYQIQAFEEPKRMAKKLKKVQRLPVYEQIVEEMWEQGTLVTAD